jgi:hypothetical protein
MRKSKTSRVVKKMLFALISLVVIAYIAGSVVLTNFFTEIRGAGQTGKR